MRFKPTQTNLEIHLSSAEIASCVRRVVDHLVPTFTKKVYLVAEPPHLFAESHFGVQVLASDQEPTNFLSSFRLIVREGTLTVVSSREQRFTKEQWRELAEHISGEAT